MEKCVDCKLEIDDTDFIMCLQCPRKVHLVCLYGCSMNNDDEFVCEKCQRDYRFEVASGVEYSKEEPETYDEEKFKTLMIEVNEDINHCKLILNIHAALTKELNRKMDVAKSSLSELANKLRLLEQQTRNMKEQLGGPPDEFASSRRNLVIYGVPKQDEENLETMVSEIGASLDLDLDGYLEEVFRCPASYLHPPIVVRFKEDFLRDELFRRFHLHPYLIERGSGFQQAIFIKNLSSLLNRFPWSSQDV